MPEGFAAPTAGGSAAGQPSAARPRVRLLALGNELLADDAFGLLVAQAARAARPDLEVADAAAGGFGLLDLILDVDRLLVVDTVASGTAAPGTIHVVRADDVLPAAGGPSPHYAGLGEVLALGRALGLAMPREVIIIAVEAADGATVGGSMHPAVRAAIPEAVRMIGDLVDAGWCRPGADHPAAGGDGDARTRADREHPEDRAR
ncbi:MAG: hydrogenase maturation protease [Armatimonadota bacterium]|nr:hydrogenase maturation protease [Armatimonadota bacterium]MDR7450499.1 hydrogenase maturation protease [Armatimonadota bacterium]MDR7466367.1 hydrogenase maturation protease [Armatimonadota bacterium]MDR7493089.1 hydrogenase maturation protease [Armatimonadota bacterium]MDR7498154.1 hydrogenase maturation protease [Armatimonadota bacterium]